MAKNAEDKEQLEWLEKDVNRLKQKVEEHNEEPAMASVGDHAMSAALIAG